MKIPQIRRVKIIGKTFALEKAKTAEALGPRFGGFIDYQKGVITLKDGMTRDDTTETLLHEIIHGVSDAMALELSEKQVTVLARGLFAVSCDNPDLLQVFDPFATEIKL